MTHERGFEALFPDERAFERAGETTNATPAVPDFSALLITPLYEMSDSLRIWHAEQCAKGRPSE